MSQNVWATIMPFGPVTNFLLAQKFFFGPAKAGAHIENQVSDYRLLGASS
jgi:hypothetical protein